MNGVTIPASTVPVGKKGSRLWPGGDASICAAIAIVEIVSVEVEAAPFTVTDAGEKLHAEPAGKPEHANVTVPVYPPLGMRVSTVAADVPGATEPAAGLAAIAKSGLAALTTRLTTLEVPAAKMLSPLYCAVNECVPAASDVLEKVAVP